MQQRDEDREGSLGHGRGSRRGFLKTAGALALGAGAVGTQIDGSAADAAGLSPVAGADGGQSQSFRAVKVDPSDRRYRSLVTGFNQRWVGKPAYIQVVAARGMSWRPCVRRSAGGFESPSGAVATATRNSSLATLAV